MSRKIIVRAIETLPFGITYRKGRPGKPAETVPMERAARLNVSGVVSADGKTVTVPATDATPRMVVLSNALAQTASNPNGKASKTGVPVSDATLRAIIADHGWKTIGALFPQDGSDPTPESRKALDPAEVGEWNAYWENLTELEDFADEATSATL